MHSIDANAQSTIVVNTVTISTERLRQLEYIEANYESIIERAVLDRIETEARNKRVTHSTTCENKLSHKHVSTVTS